LLECWSQNTKEQERSLAAAVHFTFIALTPIIDVVFLSYQYKFFACEWSADGKAELKPL